MSLPGFHGGDIRVRACLVRSDYLLPTTFNIALKSVRFYLSPCQGSM